MNPGYLFLALHILGTVSFGHVMKWALRRNCALAAVGAINYVVASVFSLIVGMLIHSAPLSVDALGAGVMGGVSYVVSFYFYYQTMRLAGVSVSTAAVRVSMVPAVVASILIWGERPGAVQVIGIILVLAALPLLSQQPGDKGAKLGGKVWQWLLAVFITTSGGYVAAKMFQELGIPDAKPFLLAAWFGTAAVVAFIFLGVQRLGPTRDDYPLGVLLGLMNVVGNFCLLASLEFLPGAIVFPASSAAGVLLAVVSSAFLWRERLSRGALAGVVVAIPALVLMNLPT